MKKPNIPIRDYWRLVVIITLIGAMFAVGALLSGCAVNPQTGKTEVVVPKNPSESLYVAYGTLTEVRGTANDMFRAGLITEAQLAEYDLKLKDLRAQLDMAKGYIKGGSEVQAASLIDLTVATLFRLRQEILRRQSTIEQFMQLMWDRRVIEWQI